MFQRLVVLNILVVGSLYIFSIYFVFQNQFFDFLFWFVGKCNRKGEKNGKGLWYFFMKVCEKVQRKGIIFYNEVVDELVVEFSVVDNYILLNELVYDQKNIRWCVYDVLNVLMVMNIIFKEKKEIKWIGLFINLVQECQNLEVERQRRFERIKQKQF